MTYSHLGLATALAVMLSACANNPDPTATPVEPTLDDNTGEMVAPLRDTLVLARPVLGVSVTARDYAYLGPVEIDNSGARAFYLWVGLGSTIDRSFAKDRTVDLQEIALTLDGEQVNYPLVAWHEDAHDSPFEVATPLYQSLRASVTLEDLEHIARAETIGMRLVDDTGSTVTYSYWQGSWSQWSALADDTELGFTVQVHSPPLQQ